MTHLDLFSGIGGVSLASHWAGFETVQFVERDEFCQKVLAKNFPGVPIHGDVTTFDGRAYEGIDLLSAGWPCQPHSLAGKRLASGDERDLWSEVVRVLGEAKPRWFLGENVPGLLTSESGRFFGRVVNDLAALGFSVGWCCYGACDVGAVHRRNRVFIVAYSAEFASNVSTAQKLSFWSEGQIGGEDCKRDATDSKSQQGGGLFIRRLRQDFAPSVDAPHPQNLLCNGGDYQPKRGVPKLGNSHRSTDWRSWGIEPVVCRSNDDVSRRVDVARLKALGNAVVPAQVYPILKAIAEASR